MTRSDTSQFFSIKHRNILNFFLHLINKHTKSANLINIEAVTRLLNINDWFTRKLTVFFAKTRAHAICKTISVFLQLLNADQPWLTFSQVLNYYVMKLSRLWDSRTGMCDSTHVIISMSRSQIKLYFVVLNIYLGIRTIVNYILLIFNNHI